MSAYSYYFAIFYMKYVPVNSIYTLAIMMSLSDLVSCIIFPCLKRKISTKLILVYSYGTLAIFSLLLTSLIYITTE